MTAETTLQDAIVAASTGGDIPNLADAHTSLRILRTAIIDSLPKIRAEVLDAFNEGEDQGFASGSLNGFEQGVVS